MLRYDMDNRDLILLKRVHDLELSIKDFKSSQPTGTDSARTYVNMSNDEWDEEWTSVADAGGFFARRIRIRFKADHQDAPFGRIRVIAQFNGVAYNHATPSSAYLSSTNNFLSCHDDVLGNGFNLDDPQLEEFEDPRLLRFETLLSAVSAGVIVKLKYIIDATDTGRIYTV